MERKEILVIALIVVVLLAVGLQTIQLAGLTKTESTVPASTGGAVKAASTSDSSASVPANLKDLPSMVGGC